MESRPTSITRPSGSRHAFTLLETCVTLGLVALVATIALPRLGGRGAAGLDATVDDLVRRLTAARWRAVVEHRVVTVTFDDLPPGLTVVTDEPLAADDGAGGVRVVFAPLPAALPRTLVLADATAPRARITVPPGLGAIGVAYEDPS
jgi:hypothetical protein